jgi:hypothetical protein
VLKPAAHKSDSSIVKSQKTAASGCKRPGAGTLFYHTTSKTKGKSMQRKEILPGVMLTQLPAPAFKRCRVSLNFILPPPFVLL